MSKTAVILTNYNMTERTDALCEYLLNNSDRNTFDLIVVDNGSDLVSPSKYTKVWLPINRQTMGGWLAGVDSLAGDDTYDSYVFTITSIEFPSFEQDIIGRLREVWVNWTNSVMISPALTADSTTAWNHMKASLTPDVRQTWMLDNLFTFYDKAWYNAKGGFDPMWAYGWGVDLEMSYFARKEGKEILLAEDIVFKKVTDIGYAMNRMRMTAEQRRVLARTNMETYMRVKHGDNWEYKMKEAYTNGLK